MNDEDRMKAIIADVDEAIARFGDPEAGGFRVGNAGKKFLVTREEVITSIAKSGRNPRHLDPNDIGRFVSEIVIEKRNKQRAYFDREGRSGTQRAILAYLRTFEQPIGGRIGHLPRVGDIIDMLHLRHTQPTYDKIGKSLAGLRKRGEIEVHFGPKEKYGKGGRWYLKTSNANANEN